MPLAILKLALLLIWTLVMTLLAQLLTWLKKDAAVVWCMQAYSRVALRIIGVRLRVEQSLSTARPLLLVTNHMSYLDILILAASTPVRFCPKSEIAGWPLAGWIARLTGCVFIDRRVQKTAQNQSALHSAMNGTRPVCLFPEGTTGDGRQILPFRSSYFSLVEPHSTNAIAGLTIQPALIRYTRIGNLPITIDQLPKIAWYGDMELLPHVLECLRLGSIHAQLEFIAPLEVAETANRKALAAECQAIISKQFYENSPRISTRDH